MEAIEQAAAQGGILPRARKKKLRKQAILLGGAVLLALTVVVFARSRAESQTAQTLYTTEAVRTRDIVKALSGSGTLNPANSYTVTTLIEGEVLSADFEEGDVVEKGTVLYEVDSSDVANSIQQAERSLAQSELSYAQSQRSLSQSQRSYEDTVETSGVRADKGGVVYELKVREGDKVTAGQAVALIRDSAVMTLKVPFPADDAAGFYVGQEAAVTLDSSFETLSGTVSEISGASNVGVGNMLTRNVTIEVENPGALTDGQAAAASVNGVNCALSASFAYRSESTVTAEASGTVENVLVCEGDAVTKGQTLVTLGGDLDDAIQKASDSLSNASGSVTSAGLSVENARLSLENARSKINDYTITSPIGGTIVDKQYKAGDTIEAGKQLCTIYDLSYLEMTLNIDELDISAIAVGQNVSITADAVEGAQYSGTVTRVSVAGTTTNGTTTYPVTIRIDETDGLLPGMNVDAEIIVRKVSDALSVPNAAVNRGGLVLVTEDSPSAANASDMEAPEGYAYVSVETGISDDDYVQIVSGLSAEDTVAYIRQTAETSAQMPMMGMGGGFGGAPGGMGGGRPGGMDGARPGGAPSGGGPF